MENLKINETPVRTSRNFNINNIKLENVEIPEKIKPFENILIENENSNIKIDNKTIKTDLVYGISKQFVENIKDNANQNININVDGNNKKEVKLNFEFNSKNNELQENIQINANKNSKATIIIKYISKDSNYNFHNGIIKTNAKSNSDINIILINFLNNNSNNFISIENNFEESAKIKYTIIDFGGKNSITNYYSNLLGEKSENEINTIYLGQDGQLFDLNYIAELRGQKSNVNIEVQGALKDNSKKHFKGTIDFKKGCKKSKGNENEACMLLSKKAKSIALPMLLCSEEDVEGNHSSSAGKADEKEVFYIMSRGFSLKDAMKLIVRARFNKIIEEIKNEEIKNEILEEIDKRLD